MEDPKPVLITGCSSGIGYAAAHALRTRGYRVFASARRPSDAARLSAEGLETLNLDMDDSRSIRAAVDEMLERSGGRVYGLFNNAAWGQPGAVEDLRRDVLRAQFETNLFGLIELTNRLIPVMRAQGEGRIVQNSSVLGLITLPFRGAYSASKFALEGLSDTLRLELQGSGVSVSLIESGPIESRFRANALQKFRENIDIGNSVFSNRYQGNLRR
ncbi:MAG: SDR family NAD(P)-dependent oxidoreductase, partial [Pseudomonadota bacterium]|nr:SDR family NAD(P)-dependent oxidoreductase [Pseudomonadota bacterium]